MNHDPNLPDGFDLRDIISRAENRTEALLSIQSRIKPVPRKWVLGTEPLVTPRPDPSKVSTNGVHTTNGYHVGNGVADPDEEQSEDNNEDVDEGQDGDLSGAGGDDGNVGSLSIPTLPCNRWKDLTQSWRRAAKFTEGLESGLAVMSACIMSTPLGGDQVWVKAVSAPSSGKSMLCEALSIATKYVIAKSTIRGFHSGYKVDKLGAVDTSLIAKLKNKTLVIKDGDTLLRSPNLEQILSEARDLYDRVARTDFRNGMARQYLNHSVTFILCGTASLHQLDSSELGERFLDCVLVDKMEPELEREIARRKAFQTDRDMRLIHDPKLTIDSPEMTNAKQLTGGYIEHLREDCHARIEALNRNQDTLYRCASLAEFVSFMRTRPSKTQEETIQRELCFRLTSQLTKLSGCLACVLNKTERDSDVMALTEKVAMDTCRGRTFQIAKYLFLEGRTHGCSTSMLEGYTHETASKLRGLLKFLERIDVLETFKYVSANSLGAGRPRYRLSERFHNLYTEIFGNQ